MKYKLGYSLMTLGWTDEITFLPINSCPIPKRGMNRNLRVSEKMVLTKVDIDETIAQSFGENIKQRMAQTMEMCYDGALVMPSSYAVMSEDEMMYVDGGKLKVSQAAAIIDLAFAAYAGGFYLAPKFGSGYLKWWLKKNVPNLVRRSASVLAAVGVVNTVLGTTAQICAAIDVAFSWGSLGGVIANVIDLVDKNKRKGMYLVDGK